MKNYYFTSEAVSEGHPDKVADQISDAILDAYLEKYYRAHVAVETLVTYQTVVLSGEISGVERLNHEAIVREVIERIGYNDEKTGFSAKGVTVLDFIHEQSRDINQGVNREDGKQGAGDQGMMFGYACNETRAFIPATLYIANAILKELASIRKGGWVMQYLQPDSKAQVTICYDENNKPLYIKDIVISTQHSKFGTQEAMHEIIENDIKTILLPKVIKGLGKLRELITDDTVLHINPTGNFVEGGPAADTGLTGRKIIVDTYGGRGAHGGGAFSGKDPSKVDRSAAYMARYLAKNFVEANVCKECLIQLAYVIGETQPVSVHVNTFNTGFKEDADELIEQYIKENYDLSPEGIDKFLRLHLQRYLPTAAYGHFGREVTENSFSWESTQDAYQIRSLFDWLKIQ